MARRITAAKVLAGTLATVLTLGGVAVLSACANNRGGSRSVPEGIEYTVVVENESKDAVDVAWTVAFRRLNSDELGPAQERSLGVVEPGSTGRGEPSTFGMAPAHAAEYVQVFRIRLTIPSASWQEPARMWWEVVGPLPKKFVVEHGPGPDSFKVRLRADGAAMEAVPRQFWPEADQ